MFCKFCGKPLDDGTVFCKYCGKQLDAPSQPAQAAQPSPPASAPLPPPQFAPPLGPMVYPPGSAQANQGAKPKRTGAFAALAASIAALLGALAFGLSQLDVFSVGIVGTWELVELEIGGETLSAEESEEEYGELLSAIKYEFKDNGEFLSILGDLDTEGTYEVDGSDILVTIDDDTQTLTLEGGRLLHPSKLLEADVLMTFEKS